MLKVIKLTKSTLTRNIKYVRLDVTQTGLRIKCVAVMLLPTNIKFKLEMIMQKLSLSYDDIINVVKLMTNEEQLSRVTLYRLKSNPSKIVFNVRNGIWSDNLIVFSNDRPINFDEQTWSDTDFIKFVDDSKLTIKLIDLDKIE